VRCHGTVGRGDGPEGARLGARDLGDPAWQDAMSDERLRAVVTGGSGDMPAFDLPDSTLDDLVGLIRKMRAQRPTRAAPPP